MRTTRPIKRGKDGRGGGFTLLELVIVVLVIGIAAMAAVPNLAASERDAILYAACAEVMTALEYAQMTAMTSGRPYRVTFDASHNTLEVEQKVYEKLSDVLNTGNTTLGKDKVESLNHFVSVQYPPRPSDDYIVDFDSATAFAAVNIASASFGSDDVVTFDGSGHPSAGGAVTMTYGGRQAVVSLNAATGKVTRTQ